MLNVPFSQVVADLNHGVEIKDAQVHVVGDRKLDSLTLETESVTRLHVNEQWFIGLRMTVSIEDQLTPRPIVSACYVRGPNDFMAVTAINRVPAFVLRRYCDVKDAATDYVLGKVQSLDEALEVLNGK